MDRHNFEIGFFYTVIAIVFAFLFFVFKPFITPLFLALVFASVFYPVHTKILSMLGGRRGVSATMSTAMLVLIIVVPLTIVALLMLSESINVYNVLSQNNFGAVGRFVDSLNVIITNILPTSFAFDISTIDLGSSMQKVVGSLASNANTLFSSAFSLVLGIILFIISLFYFFKEGDKLVKKAIGWSPLADSYDEIIAHKISVAFNSVIRGNIITALAQGFLAGVGFFVAGIGAPILLGFVVVIASLIPSIGTAIVMIPAVLYLFATGSIWAGIFLLVWAVLVVGLIDNLLKPILMEKGISVHPFVILLSVLGGIAFFGPVGLIAGPVLIAVAAALIELRPMLSKK